MLLLMSQEKRLKPKLMEAYERQPQDLCRDCFPPSNPYLSCIKAAKKSKKK